jgi:hypothetical protein
VNWNEPPESTIPESKTPSREVTEWELPEKVQRTVSPAWTVREAGEKSKSSTATEAVAASTGRAVCETPVIKARNERLRTSRAAARRVEGLVIGW